MIYDLDLTAVLSARFRDRYPPDRDASRPPICRNPLQAKGTGREGTGSWTLLRQRP